MSDLLNFLLCLAVVVVPVVVAGYLDYLFSLVVKGVL